MAGFFPDMKIVFTAEVAGAISAISNLGKEMDKTVAKAEKAGNEINKMGATGKFAIGGINAIAVAVAAIGYESVKAATAVEGSQAAMNAAFAATGSSLTSMSPQIQSVYDKMANLDFSVSETSDALAKGAIAFHSTSEALKYIGLAADIARAKNIPLADAMTILGRAANGQARGLSALGVEMPKTGTNAQKFQSVTEQLTKSLKDQAAVYAQTHPMETMKTKLDELGVTIGTAILPAFTAATKAIGNFISWLTKHKQVVVDVVAGLAILVLTMKTYSATTAIVEGVTKAWTIATTLARAAMALLKGEQLQLNAAMDANPIGAIVALVVLLAAGFVVLWNRSKTFRDAMVDIGKVAVEAIGFQIKMFGDLAVTILKVVTGPMKMFLTALSYIPGVGKYANDALNFINTGITDIGNFFNAASAKVDSFANKLNALSNMKISLPSLTPPTETPASGGAGGGGGGTGTPISKSQALINTYLKTTTDAYTKFNQTVTDLVTKREQDEADIIANYNTQKLALDEQYTISLGDIIKQSIQEMTNAFASATSLNIGDVFTQMLGGLPNQTSITNLITQFTRKLTAAQNLAMNANKLQQLGFSQQFIDQVIGAGATAGNLLAQQIENATPEQIAQLKDVYDQLNTVSNTGVTSLAQTMSNGVDFANAQLAQQYAQTQTQYADALNKLNASTQDQLNKAQQAFDMGMTVAQNTLSDALHKAFQSLSDSLAKTSLTSTQQLQVIKSAMGALNNSAEVKAFQNLMNNLPYQIGIASQLAALTGNTGVASSLAALQQLALGYAKAQTSTGTVLPSTLGGTTAAGTVYTGGTLLASGAIAGATDSSGNSVFVPSAGAPTINLNNTITTGLSATGQIATTISTSSDTVYTAGSFMNTAGYNAGQAPVTSSASPATATGVSNKLAAMGGGKGMVAM